MVDVAKMNFDNGSWQEALYEVYVGITVGSSHGWYFLKKNAMGFAAPVLGAFGVETGGKKKNASIKEAKDLKVVGVGYGRTGTVSLLASFGLSHHWWGGAVSTLVDGHALFFRFTTN